WCRHSGNVISDLPDLGLLDLARGLIVGGQKTRHRRTLVLSGEAAWCRHSGNVISDLPELRRVVWVTTEKLTDVEAVDAGSVKSLLGQECDAVVFDAFSGFDPDAFGAICGTIRAGGLLILLCPPLNEWEKFPDPASERIAISPFSYKDISGRFIRRLVSVIRDANGVTVVDQHSVEKNKSLPSIESAATSDELLDAFQNKEHNKKLNEECCTEDQQAAVEAIEHVMGGHRRRPAVLVSDRGRGKSAALGIAAARLLINADSQTDGSKSVLNIVVTAPRPGAVEALFSQAQSVFEKASLETKIIGNCLQFKQSKIQYIAPDELYSLQEPVDLVLVDEAAAIPTSMLTQFLKKYSRIAFATTVHGYEGAGRGFAVRFRQTLNDETPGWNEVRLQKPIRWADNDPLEQLVFHSLLLDAESAKEKDVEGVNDNNVTVECLDREALANDEQTLSQLFGLLVSAHYRTTPNDLRNLLDGPGVSVYVMRSHTNGENNVIATALVSAEGEFSDELTDAIFTGQRRPRGHLIPQSLVTHVGLKQAAKCRYARIMRIAVHPALQRKALGSKMVSAIRREAEAQGFHMLGVSFGATVGLMKFWREQGMCPVRVGFRRDQSSGEHSVMMLRPLAEQGEKVFQSARRRLAADLPYWLADTLQDLDSAVAMQCLQNEYAEQFALTSIDEQVVSAFANGERNYEDCSAALWRFTVEKLMSSENSLNKIEQMLLITRILQNRTWKEAAMLCGLTGRADVINGLREAVLCLLNQTGKNAS
ncbi:MAG: GNAT family N-acetyltransferase, partial [Gammaproteobacteria bacterium]